MGAGWKKDGVGEREALVDHTNAKGWMLLQKANGRVCPEEANTKEKTVAKSPPR